MSSDPQTPGEGRRLREQVLARVARDGVVPPQMPMLWCVYYAGADTELVLRALDGEYQFAERDGARAPQASDIAFAAWGGPNARVHRHAWPGDQTIAMLAFGRVASASPNRLQVRPRTVWRDVQQRHLSPAVADRLHLSAISPTRSKPLLCAAVGQPDLAPLAA